MPDNSQILQILLKVQADISELQGKLNPALAETTTQLKEASSAGNELSSVLAGAVGGAVVAGIGAIAVAIINIPKSLGEIGEKLARDSEELRNANAALDQHISKWVSLAEVAGSSRDALDIGKQVAASLNRAGQEFDEFRKKTLDFWDTIKNSLTSFPLLSPKGLLQEGLDAQTAGAEQRFRTLIQGFNGVMDAANEAAEAWKRIQAEPAAQGIVEVTARIQQLKE